MGAIALLEEGGNDVGRLLVELVGHSDPEVRVFALDRCSTRSDPVPPHLLSAVLSSDPSSDVRAAAARLAGRAGRLDIARPALDGPDPACRRAAAIGLLEASDASVATAVRERLSPGSARRTPLTDAWRQRSWPRPEAVPTPTFSPSSWTTPTTMCASVRSPPPAGSAIPPTSLSS